MRIFAEVVKQSCKMMELPPAKVHDNQPHPVVPTCHLSLRSLHVTPGGRDRDERGEGDDDQLHDAVIALTKCTSTNVDV